jgi:colanic acid biosynthesis glycosyl transferase WcaI
MKQTLWIVSELYYPEATSTGYILTKLAEGLNDSFTVNVICGQPSYSARGTKAPVKEVHNGVFIRRCWGTTLNKDVLPLRLLNLLTITMTIFLAALRSVGRNDLVLVVTNPPSLPFVIALACQLKRAKCSLIIHDIYPDLAVAAGKLKDNSFLTKWLAQLNVRLYRRMARIFVVGRDMQVKVMSKLDKQPERVVIATNWADLDMIEPRPRSDNALLQELDLSDKFVLLYAGNMGYPNDIEMIVETAVLLRENTDIHFLFIGSGAKRAFIQSAIEKRRLSNVTLLGPRPRHDQINFLNACDVALIALVSGMKGVSVPSRTYNTLASGTPIIAISEAQSELAFVVEEEGIGWVVPPGEPNRLVTAVLEARNADLTKMSIKARLAAENEYSFDRVLHTFQQNLHSVSGANAE